ncbi:MAG: HAMP domain-containing histidine kinase [Dehalococcoidia bacterium]|nr:HAMP domain-containing histidine kinase [Dehalococcoidia bacterium]
MVRRLLLAALLVGAAAYLGSLVHPSAAAVAAGLGAALAVFIRPSVVPVAAPAAAEVVPAALAHEAAPEEHALLDHVSDAVLVLDAQRLVVHANVAARTLLASEGGALVGRPLLRSAWSAELGALVAAATGIPQEVTLPGGRTLLASAFAVDRAGARTGARTGLVLTEISASRRADRARSELVANLSHEIRTPVAAARALAETLEVGVEDEERRQRYQRQLLTELDRLSEIVARAMRLSRIETGGELLEIAPQEPGRLLQSALLHVAPLAEVAGVRLEDASEPQLPAVRADFERVIEVLTVLLDNAIKFSPPAGLITVRGSLDVARPAFVTFEVRDQGPGVLPGERERVFERLYTGDPARATSGDRAGFGLGLAIARHLIARHGGQIWIEDVPGPGASFRFTLPLVPEGD